MAANSSSMNNWLAFSLSPQHHHPHSSQHAHFNSDDQISGTDVSTPAGASECFDLSSHDECPLPSLNLPPPFGILEVFNPNTSHPSQDWKSSAEMSMLMGSSCSGQSLESGGQGPKFENFLGVGNGGGDYMYPHCSMQLPTDAVTAVGPGDGGGGSGGGRGGDTTSNCNNNSNIIGLSMIKNWLRNNPTPPSQPLSDNNNNNNDGGGGGGRGVGGDAVMGTTNSGVSLSSAQTLSLSMSTGSQSSPLGGGESSSSDNKRQMEAICLDSQTAGAVAAGAIEAAAVPRKSIDTFGQRTSIYRGVTRHRWTGRYEAHLWDNSCRREGQTRKGRQVYLGGYDKEEKAARAYDLAALKYWGTTTTTNFPISTYEIEVEEMKNMTRQEYVASLRRKSSGFSRGASIYRGVTRHHQHGRWQARIGRVAGNKDLYLGTFSTQEEAAEAYDIAAIKFRGLNAVTNFEINRYDVKSILESSTLPIGGAAKRLKEAAEQAAADQMRTDHEDNHIISTHLSHAAGISSAAYAAHQNWPTIAYHQTQQPPFSMQHYPYGSTTMSTSPHQQRLLWCKQEVQDSDIIATNHQGFQDLHHQVLQLGDVNTPHNFFQQPTSVLQLHNLMNLDSSSMEHSSGSNSVNYNTGNGGYAGYGHGSTNGGFAMPMGAIIAQEENHNQEGNGYGENNNEVNPYGTTDPYGSRNLYYQLSGSMTKASTVYDQGSACNDWVPTAVPTSLAPRASNMTVCHGGTPTFTVWNDT